MKTVGSMKKPEEKLQRRCQRRNQLEYELNATEVNKYLNIRSQLYLGIKKKASDNILRLVDNDAILK